MCVYVCAVVHGNKVRRLTCVWLYTLCVGTWAYVRACVYVCVRVYVCAPKHMDVCVCVCLCLCAPPVYFSSCV